MLTPNLHVSVDNQIDIKVVVIISERVNHHLSNLHNNTYTANLIKCIQV